jgi:hypothetical protein
MPPAISIMDAPEIAPVTLPAKGMRIGRRRQYLDGTLHKRQTRFHSISIDYAVSLNTQGPSARRSRSGSADHGRLRHQRAQLPAGRRH